MGDRGFDQAVQAFIAREIYSVEQLEVLLLLHRSPEREWTAADVGSELRTSPVSAARRLQDLKRRSLLAQIEDASPERYRFDPQILPVAPEVIARLEACYRKYRIRVIELIFTRRGGALEAFLDAFHLGKEGK